MAKKKTMNGQTQKNVKALQKQAQKHLDTAKSNFTKAEKQVRNYMHKHPERAALIAAGVGAAIGAAVAAAASRRKK